MSNNDPFGKWWPCLRKHFKRTQIWLPRAKELSAHLNSQRPFRYFTLCARPMIDVYMLVKENVLQLDSTGRRIMGVSFCELNENVFPEMIEMIGAEESGFRSKLEDLTLFSDVRRTKTLDTMEALEKFLNKEGERLSDRLRATVEGKRRHLQFRDLFPFDFLNLDFCDPYYEPPDVMKINSTIDKLLEWQRRPGRKLNGKEFSIDRFVMAITCRVDTTLPSATSRRLKSIIEENARTYDEYKAALHGRDIEDLSKWSVNAPLDFFMSAWPKEMARFARVKQWDIKIHDHTFYERVNDEGETYHIVCLVVEFTQAPICNTYLKAATQSLDQGSRTEIGKIKPTGADSKHLLADLRLIVDLRNGQAKRVGRDELPEPLAEMKRLNAEGVPI